MIRCAESGPVHLQLGQPIGSGGMAIIRAATQLPLRREVAVKTLRDDVTPSDYEALRNEARALGTLEHPNVVPVYMLGTDESKRPLIVMKRIEGTVALEAFLQYRHSWDLTQACNLKAQQVHARLDPAAEMAGSQAEEKELYDLFAECRFGFQQALTSCPDSAEAKDGLQRLIEAMIRHELGRKDINQAERLLSQLPEPSKEMSARVEAARADLEIAEREQEILLAAGRELDLRVASKGISALPSPLPWPYVSSCSWC